MRLKTLRRSHKRDKKWDAVFEKDGKEKVVPFGAKVQLNVLPVLALLEINTRLESALIVLVKTLPVAVILPMTLAVLAPMFMYVFKLAI